MIGLAQTKKWFSEDNLKKQFENSQKVSNLISGNKPQGVVGQLGGAKTNGVVGTKYVTPSKDAVQQQIQAAHQGYFYPPSKETKVVDAEVPKTDLPTDLYDFGKDKGGGSYTPSTASFQPSQTYLKAMEYTNSLLQQLSSGRTSYTDQINDLMNQITNREKFSYDMDTDTLFQNSLQNAMASGKVAMQDTMGQAAALTGGYGSTYATSAANQAYNGYIQDAYANLPDYYNLALEAYNMEGQNLQNQLGMYMEADNNEYNRLANAYSANMQNAANMYDREYNNFWQSQNFNENSRQYAASLADSNAKWKAQYAKDLEGNNLDQKEAYSRVVSAWNKFGDSDDFYQVVADLGNMGYDVDDLISHANANGDAPAYTFNSQSGYYNDQWGKENTTAPVFTQIDKDNWVDQFGNPYTTKQKKDYEKRYKNATSGK